ncbi:hypothetical protein GCM10027047_21060 [Rhodococcus aerolatus]
MTRDEILGAWRLAEATQHDSSGQVVGHPFGEEPAGLILYTDDGYMSATITSAVSDDLPSVYAGPFEVTDDEVVHHVEVGEDPAGAGTVQHRGAHVADGALHLRAQVGGGEVRLRWERPAR